MQEKNKKSNSGFTLIELLITITIIAILSVVVFLTLNVPEMLRQARDGSRLSDIKTLSGVVGLYVNDFPNGGLGSTSTIYLSLPDKTLSGNQTSTCISLGLPAAPTGYTYQCTSPQSLRDIDGTGWMPVNLKQISTGSPISSLPVDPSNVSSTNLYYTYSTDGSSYVFTSFSESQKQKQSLSQNAQVPNYPGVMAQGSDVTVSPLFSVTGLVGYWPLNEGSGTTAFDNSGLGTPLTIYNLVNWVPGRNGYGYAVQMDPTISNTCVSQNAGIFQSTLPAAIKNLPSGAFSLTWWDNLPTLSGATRVHLATTIAVGGCGNCSIWNTVYSTGITDAAQDNNSIAYPIVPSLNVWHHHVFIFDKPNLISRLYVDGVQVKTGALTAGGDYGTINWISVGVYHPSCEDSVPGERLSSVRLYNRALSVSEVQAIYNAEK